MQHKCPKCGFANDRRPPVDDTDGPDLEGLGEDDEMRAKDEVLAELDDVLGDMLAKKLGSSKPAAPKAPVEDEDEGDLF